MTSHGRIKNEDRSTPFYDAWRGELERALSERGAKTSLALFLARNDTTKLKRWQVAIWKTLKATTIPGAEFVLATNAWLHKQKGTSSRPR